MASILKTWFRRLRKTALFIKRCAFIIAKNTPAFLFGAIIALGAVAVIASQNGSSGSASSKPQSSDTYELLDSFGEVFQRVRKDYVRDVKDEELIEAAIEGMVSSLDPHSAYLNPRRYRDLQVNTQGEFGGLGIEVTLDEKTGAVKVISPLDDTPASKADIKSGDLIIKIDDKVVRGMTLGKAVDILRGPIGKPVTLTIQRGKEKPFDVTLKRELIKLRVVRTRLEGNDKSGIIGYIRLASFAENVAEVITKEIKNLQNNASSPIIGYILDLRNNPGGLLDQAVAVSDLFLSSGEIVSLRGRNGNRYQRYQASKEDVTNGLPIVVLINAASASASEIVAGALKDHHRAKLLGQKSFGKGSVQTLISLKNRRGAALKLTVQHYYTPSGELIHNKGINPDVIVAQQINDDKNETENTEKEDEKSTEEAEETEAEETEAEETEAEAVEEKEATEKNLDDDTQLQRALEVIRNEANVKQ